MHAARGWSSAAPSAGPCRSTAAGAVRLRARAARPTAIAAAAAQVPTALGDAFGDGYASAEYRTHLAEVLARRALTAAFARAGVGI